MTSKFKSGDRVRVKAGMGTAELLVGSEHDVLNVSSGGTYVYIVFGNSVHARGMCEDRFELVEASTPTPAELAEEFRIANDKLYEARNALLDLGYKAYFKKPGSTAGFHPCGVSPKEPNAYEFRKEVTTTDVV